MLPGARQILAVAFRLDDGELLWIPKSVLLEVPEIGDPVDGWPIKLWFCDKEGISY